MPRRCWAHGAPTTTAAADAAAAAAGPVVAAFFSSVSTPALNESCMRRPGSGVARGKAVERRAWPSRAALAARLRPRPVVVRRPHVWQLQTIPPLKKSSSRPLDRPHRDLDSSRHRIRSAGSSLAKRALFLLGSQLLVSEEGTDSSAQEACRHWCACKAVSCVSLGMSATISTVAPEETPHVFNQVLGTMLCTNGETGSLTCVSALISHLCAADFPCRSYFGALPTSPNTPLRSARHGRKTCAMPSIYRCIVCTSLSSPISPCGVAWCGHADFFWRNVSPV